MRTKNGDHTVTSSGSNVVSSGTRWPCPGPSTIVPSLGIPFRDAAARLTALVKEQDELPDTPEADARSDEITEQWEVLGRAVLGSIPRTPADSVAVIDTALCPAIGPNMERTAKELFQRVRGVLVQAALEAVQREAGATDKSAGGSGSTMIPSVGLTFAEATTRVAALIEAQNTLMGSENPDADAERARLSAEWSDLLCAILTAEPATLADAVAVLDRLLCPHTGIGGTDIEVEALTRLRDLLARQVATSHPITMSGASGIGAMDEAVAELQAFSLKPVAPDSLIEVAAQRAGITVEQARACYDVFTTPIAKVAS